MTYLEPYSIPVPEVNVSDIQSMTDSETLSVELEMTTFQLW